ncbi:hypothetical protein [Spirillospora albida]|uniref:hypothetical protein n=1 Tax=Spirillospora albida TaxID=58123 RepID=UPI0004C1ACB0|nr:hypothetical protein [Spirillospora albida]
MRCEGDYCGVKIVKPLGGDTVGSWQSTLKRGRDAVVAYLETYNSGVGHRTDCRFRNLPPSVHHQARTYDDIDREARHLQSMGYDLP